MGTFGGYETVRQISQTGISAVFSARPAGTKGAPRLAVKTLTPAGFLVDEGQAQLQTELFLESARVQQEINQARGRCWARIHECDRLEEGAYYVADHYSRSAQNLIDLHARMTGPALYTIVSSVVEGLREIERTSKRTHGNLKPSNVLLSGQRSIDRAKVVLTDPQAFPKSDPEGAKADDLHAVGELIFQLVMHRPPRTPGEWPVAETEEWRRLGGKGAGWRGLCNGLMKPYRPAGELSLDYVAAEVQKLRHRRPRFNFLKVGATAAIILAAGLAGPKVWQMIKDRIHPPPTTKVITEAQWRVLCRAYRLYHPILDVPKDMRQDWENDTDLKKGVLDVLDDARSAGKKLDPHVIAACPDGRSPDLPDSLPAVLRAPGPRGDQALAAWTTWSSVSHGLKHWSTLMAIKRLRQEPPAKIASPALGDDLAALAKTIEGEETGFGMVAAVDWVVEIGGRWKALEDYIRTLQKTEDPKLKEFPAYALDFDSSVTDLQELWKALDADPNRAGRVDLARRLVEAYEANWDRLHTVCFLASPAHARPPEKGTFERCAVEATWDKYRLAPKRSPFVARAEDWEEPVKAVEAATKDIDTLEAGVKDRKGPEIEARLAALKAEYAEEKARACCEACLPSLGQAYEDLRVRLAKVKEEAADRVASLRLPLPAPDPREPFSTRLVEVEQKIRGVDERGVKDELEKKLTEIRAPVDLSAEWIVANEDYIVSVVMPKVRAATVELNKLVIPPPSDPRPGIESMLSGIAAGIDRLKTGLHDPLSARLADRLKAADDDWRKGGLLEDWPARRKEITERAAAIKAVLTALEAEAAARIDALGKVRGLAVASDSAAVRDAWAKALGRLEGEVPGGAALVAKADQVRKFLTACDERLPQRLPAGIERPTCWDDQKITALLRARREEQLKGLLERIDWAGQVPPAVDPQWDRGFTAWLADVEALARDFRHVETLLNEGYGWDEAPPRGKDEDEAVEAVVTRWEKPEAALKPVTDVVQPILDRVNALRALDGLDRKGLLEAAKSMADTAVAVNAWRRLGLPADVKALRQELPAVESVTALLAPRIANPQRRRLLEKEVIAASIARWQSAFQAAAAAADVEDAMQLRARYREVFTRNLAGTYQQDFAGKFWVDEDDAAIATLASAAQYNFRLFDFLKDSAAFLKRLAGLPEDKQAGALAEFAQAKIDPFVKKVSVLVKSIPEPGRTTVEAFLKDLEDLKTAKAGTGGGDLSKVGPAMAGWRLARQEPLPAGLTGVTYELPGEDLAMAFVLVSPQSGGGAVQPFFICTTEVSMGLFFQIARDRKTLEALRPLLPAETNFWVGVWGWGWRGGRVGAKSAWIMSVPGIANPYPDGIKPKEPNARHPMQRLGPAGAAAIAQAVGCRLLTPAEWKDACLMPKSRAPVAEANLRDETWNAYKGHIARLEYSPKPSWPDDKVFWPQDKPADRTGAAAEAVPGQKDGVLWFAEVDSDSAVIHHLVGNVAEYVGDPKGGYFVVGGSAMSSPALWDGSAGRPFTQAYPVEASGREGFSDVGLRLGFSAPALTLVDLARAVLGSRPYLTAR